MNLPWLNCEALRKRVTPKRQVGYSGEVVTKKENHLFISKAFAQTTVLKLGYTYFEIRSQVNLLISRYDSIGHSGSLAPVIGLEAVRPLAVKSS